jgi:hypothetical protein
LSDCSASTLVVEYHEGAKPALYVRREGYRRACTIILLFFFVCSTRSGLGTQAERVQSMDLVVKEVRPFIEKRKGKGSTTLRRCACPLGHFSYCYCGFLLGWASRYLRILTRYLTSPEDDGHLHNFEHGVLNLPLDRYCMWMKMGYWVSES